MPRWNPFDAIYNRIIAMPRNRPPLTAAPAPRRFAQGLAGTLFAGAGLALMAELTLLAWAIEAMLAVALIALVVGRFCLGSYLYLLVHGDTVFANRTRQTMEKIKSKDQQQRPTATARATALKGSDRIKGDQEDDGGGRSRPL